MWATSTFLGYCFVWRLGVDIQGTIPESYYCLPQCTTPPLPRSVYISYSAKRNYTDSTRGLYVNAESWPGGLPEGTKGDSIFLLTFKGFQKLAAVLVGDGSTVASLVLPATRDFQTWCHRQLSSTGMDMTAARQQQQRMLIDTQNALIWAASEDAGALDGVVGAASVSMPSLPPVVDGLDTNQMAACAATVNKAYQQLNKGARWHWTLSVFAGRLTMHWVPLGRDIGHAERRVVLAPAAAEGVTSVTVTREPTFSTAQHVPGLLEAVIEAGINDVQMSTDNKLLIANEALCEAMYRILMHACQRAFCTGVCRIPATKDGRDQLVRLMRADDSLAFTTEPATEADQTTVNTVFVVHQQASCASMCKIGTKRCDSCKAARDRIAKHEQRRRGLTRLDTPVGSYLVSKIVTEPNVRSDYYTEV